MKRKQRAIKEFNFDDYDFSDCVEITGDALYLINGGGAKTSGKSDSGSTQGSGKNGSSGGGNEIDNSHEAVANAKPGDYFYRDDGTKQVVNAGDIAYEKNYLQNSGNNDKATQTPETFQSTDAESPTKPASTGGSGGGSDHKGSDSTYTVNKGDTLSKIVYDHNKKYGTNLTVAEVAKKNGIKDPNKIFSGQQINLGLSQTREIQKTATQNANGDKILNFDNRTINVTKKISTAPDELLTGENISTGEKAASSLATQGNNVSSEKSLPTTDTSDINIYLSPFNKSKPKVEIENNQTKVTKALFIEYNISNSKKIYNFQAGLFQVSSELNNSEKTHIYGQAQFDFVTGGYTVGKDHIGISVSPLAVSGKLGIDTPLGIGATGLGLGSVGFEVDSNVFTKNQHTGTFDVSPILAVRLDYDGSKLIK